MKKRVIWLDIIKIIACFLVIVNHSGLYIFKFTNTTTSHIFYSINFAFCKLAVPAFIMASGAVFLKRKTTYKDMLKKIFRFAVPLIIISLISYVHHSGDYNIFNFSKTFLKDRILGPYWYLYMLIALYLLTPFIKKMVDNFDNKDNIYFIILTLIIPTFLKMVSYYTKIEISSYFFESCIPETIGLFVSGYYISNIKKNKKIFIASIITLIITLISFVFSVYVPFTKNGAFDYKFGTYNSFFAIVEALCLFYIIKHYFENKNIKCEKVINEISLCTFGIFLFHYPVIDRFFYMSIMQKIFAFNPYIGMYTLQITVFITTGLITYLLRKIPIIKKFL